MSCRTPRGGIVHDADAHIMETPTWLRDHAEAAFRDRLPVLRYPGGNELRQTGDPVDQQRDLIAAFDALRGPARLGRVPGRRGGRDHGAQELRRHRVLHRRGPAAAPSTSSASRASSSSTRSTTGGCTTWSTPATSTWPTPRPAPTTGACSSSARSTARLLPSLYVPLADPERAVAGRRATRSTQGAAALLVASGCPPRILAQPHRPLRRVGPGRGGRHPRRVPRRRDGDPHRPELLRQRQAGAARLPRRRGELPLGRLHGHPRSRRPRRWPR